MNRAYRILWNAVRHAWVCVAENTAAHRQATGTCRAATTVLALSLVASTAMAESTCNNPNNAPLECNNPNVAITQNQDGSYSVNWGSGAVTTPLTLKNTSKEAIASYLDAFDTPLYHLTGSEIQFDYLENAEALYRSNRLTPLFLENGRYHLSLPLFFSFLESDGGMKPPLSASIISHSVVKFDGSGSYYFTEVRNDFQDARSEVPSTNPGIQLVGESYLAMRSSLTLPQTNRDLGTKKSVLVHLRGSGNLLDVYSKLESSSQVIAVTGSNNIVRLNAGASISAENATRSVIELGSENTLILTAPLVNAESADGIYLGSIVTGGNSYRRQFNTLSLGGYSGEFTFNLATLNTGGKLAKGGFTRLNKVDSNTWTITGTLPPTPTGNSQPRAITSMSILGGTLVLQDFEVPETQALQIDVSGENQYDIIDEDLNRTVHQTSGVLQLKKAAFTDQTHVSIAAQGKLIANIDAQVTATADNFSFEAGGVLETNAPSISGQSGETYPWLGAFLASRNHGLQLITTADTKLKTDLSSVDIWKSLNQATIDSGAVLPQRLEMAEHQDLLFLTDFSLSTLATQTITNAYGNTIFAGAANLDELTTDAARRFALGTLMFVDYHRQDLTPTLVTGLRNEEDFNTIVSKFDQSTLAVATLQTNEAIHAGALPAKFKTWNLTRSNASGSTATTATAIPAYTRILTNGYLTPEMDTVDSDRTIEINNGGVLFANNLRMKGNLLGEGDIYANGTSRLIGSKAFEGNLSLAGSILTLDNADLPEAAIVMENASPSNTILYAKAKQATSPTPMARRSPRMVLMSASDSTPSTEAAATPGVTHLESLTIDGQLEVDALSPTNYTKIEVTNDINVAENSTLHVYLGRFSSNADLSDVLKSVNGTITRHFAHVTTNADSYFTVTPDYVDGDKVMNLKVAVNAAPPATWQPVTRDGPVGETSAGGNENENEHEGNENQEGGNQQGGSGTRPVPDGLLTSIAKRHGRLATVPMARAMDAVVAQNSNNLADFGLLTSHNEDDIAAALSQSMPLLAGTGNRALMDAMREMTRPMATDRCSDPTARHTWASAVGDWSRRNASGGAMGYDANHTGIAVGGDACIERLKNTRLGFTGAYTHTDADSRGTSADQNLKANSWMVGLYGNTPLNDAWDVDFNVNAGRSSVKGTRNLTLANRIAKSKADATLVTAGAGLNWHLMVSDKMTVTPFVRADYSRVAMDGYTETGAKGLNLAVEKQTSQSFVTRVGVKSEWALTPAWSLSATAAVGADLLDKGHEVSASFAQFPGSTFTVENDRHGRAVADLVLGTAYAITPAVTFSANAIAGVAKGTNHTALDARVTWKF